jgi:hypothetical protein
MRLLDLFKKKDKINTSSNMAVFTTKNVMIENLLITRVYYDTDKSLQFFDDYSTNSNQNIMIVGLQEILRKDSSVSDALNMPIGHVATRKTKQDKWKIERFEEEEE